MEFIVGTALAGVPIVLEAYDRYWDLSDGLRIFRNYSKELAKLDTIIGTHKALFRGNIVQLLTEITRDQEKARSLLSDYNSETWQQVALQATMGSNRLDALRDAFASWRGTLELVHSAIATICLEMEGFRTSNTGLDARSLPKETLKQIPKRFRLCWNKREVQTSLKELREFTSDFRELTARIVSELRDTQRPTPLSISQGMRRDAGQLSALEKYHQVRSASSRLFDTFVQRWSCARHHGHGASISLVNDSPKAASLGDSINFDVAIDCEVTQALPREASIWLEVQSAETSCPPPPPQTGETQSDGSWRDMMENITKESQPLSNQQQSIPASDSAIPTATVSTGSLVDLNIVDDFCEHFRLVQPAHSYTCVGYIKDLGIHRFYLPPQERRPAGQKRSLTELITWISEDEFSRTLPRTVVTHLAGDLATAVLQYHSTPWLPETWKSNDVHFFGIKELSDTAQCITSMTPFFRVEFPIRDKGSGQPATVHQDTGVASGRSMDAASPPSVRTVTRNALLFGLGIVLLELGYSQPWSQLRERPFSTLPPQRRNDYHIAEQLAQSPLLRSRMGPRFAKIVRQCLGCDFGLGENDLANEQLQWTFLVDVIKVLQDLEKGLRDLESGY
ncbi:hypothetical protein GQ53DRAFT_854322 [Thozetella sp. PMI_491]|nr:hypothetical protein GQ53DRAFT_854322 [Thozetella sp. PMI_491]